MPDLSPCGMALDGAGESGIFIFESRMEKEDQLLKWAENHRGNLKAITRKHGTAYLYRYCRGGLVNSINFPAGAPEDFIKARITEIESKLLDEKLGIGEGPQVQHRKRKRLTLKELTEWYIRVSLQEKSAVRTVESNEYAMRKFMDWLGDENFHADDVRRSHLNEFSRYLLQNGYSPNGAKPMLARVIRVFRKASYEEMLDTFPFAAFQFPKREEVLSRPVLSLAEMREIADFFQRSRTRLAWEVARFTGMRGADIIKLQAENVDYVKRTIKFWSAKLHRWELLPIHPKLVEVLEPCRGKSGPLFSYNSDKALSIQFRKKIWEYKGKDFKPAGSHTPRHSLGAYLRNTAKWQWPDIQMFLCHRPQSITARYTHDQIEHLRALVDGLPLDGGIS